MKTFTPRLNARTNKRAEIQLNEADFAKIGRGNAWEAYVIDQTTGANVFVRGCACSLPRCFCDAYIAKPPRTTSVGRRYSGINAIDGLTYER